MYGWSPRASAWTPTGPWSTAASQFAAAVKTDGTLWTWGRNNLYQLGQNDTGDRLVPTEVGADTDWVQVSCSDRDARALKDGGSLWAWGYNNFGQLGVGDVVTRRIPTEVGGSWGLLSCGDDSSLATLPDGTLWAWGDNTYGQLGQGDTAHRAAPAAVGSESDWIIVVSGNDHVGAVRADGGLWMWGKNGSYQLGLGDTTHRLLPAFAFYVDDSTGPTIASVSSSSHPVSTSWYVDTTPTFDWAPSADASGVVQYRYVLDQSAVTTPTMTADGQSLTWTAPAKADGAWYFHVCAGDAAGNWGPASHKKVMIDTTAPADQLRRAHHLVQDRRHRAPHGHATPAPAWPAPSTSSTPAPGPRAPR